MTLALVTAPAGEPLLLSDVKEFLRVDHSNEDALLDGLTKTVRRLFDGPDAWFNRALITQTWDLLLDAFPCKPDRPYSSELGIPIPLAPLQAVTSISYIDTAGVPQVVASLDYVVDTKSEPGRITPAYGKVWPYAREVANAVTVRFVAGYGAAAAVPEDIKTWLKQAIGFYYARREAGTLFGVAGITGNTLPAEFFWSMANYKVVS